MSKQLKHHELEDYLRRAPSRKWLDGYLDLIASLIAPWELSSKDPRLVISAPRSDRFLPVSMNRRYVLAGTPLKAEMTVGYIMDSVGASHYASEIPVLRMGRFGRLPHEKAADRPWFIYTPDPTVLIRSGHPRHHWENAYATELARCNRSPYKKHHEPLLYRLAVDNKFRQKTLEKVFVQGHSVGSNGLCYGDPVTNAVIEKRAVKIVRQQLQGEGYTVESTEMKGCGYDLLCVRGEEELHVEVKGTSGSVPAFFITPNELRQAQVDKRFKLYVVTDALEDSPIIQSYEGKQIADSFEISPSQYKGVLQA